MALAFILHLFSFYLFSLVFLPPTHRSHNHAVRAVAGVLQRCAFDFNNSHGVAARAAATGQLDGQHLGVVDDLLLLGDPGGNVVVGDDDLVDVGGDLGSGVVVRKTRSVS